MEKLAQVDIGSLKLAPERNIRDLGTIGNLISIILPNVYLIAGIILLFLLIGGGFAVIVNAGSDNPEGAAKGQKAVTSAIIGFLLIFTSYWIIKIIESITGLNILS